MGNGKNTDWKENALETLENSLYPIPSELNQLDWKSDLSDKSERLAEHLCAFSNYKGGGYLVYGVNNDASFGLLTQDNIEEIVRKLANIAKNNLSIAISIEHAVLEYQGHSLLFVRIPEQVNKPIYKRGRIYDAYTRSGGSTMKMDEAQIKYLIAESKGQSFEKMIARKGLTKDEVLTLLDYKKLYEILEKKPPKDNSLILDKLFDLGYCVNGNEEGLWDVTNLGAILFAKSIKNFEELSNRSVIVRIYDGNNNLKLLHEQVGTYGYAVGFEGLVDYIMANSSTEEIQSVRTLEPTYPLVAIREFVANALIHQDFAITGMPVTIEIFKNRLVITNPGSPLGDINRLLDMPPRSRNEELAQAMLLLNFCERRGSGIDRAIAGIEKMLLPAPKFEKGTHYTRIKMFPRKKLSEMTKQEKIMACYQHACLSYESNKSINNQSVRERFGMDRNSSSVASRIISDTLEANLIKLSDASITSKKYASYIPFYG